MIVSVAVFVTPLYFAVMVTYRLTLVRLVVTVNVPVVAPAPMVTLDDDEAKLLLSDKLITTLVPLAT